MYILGIYNGHNATATLTRDGQVIASASEERFNGIKNFIGFPYRAINYCLKEGNISSENLDLVVRSTTIGSPIHVESDFKKDFTISLMNSLHRMINPIRKIWGDLAYKFPKLRILGDISYTVAARTLGRVEMTKEREAIAKRLNISKYKVNVFDHHDCHAFSAYFASPFNQDKALVLVLDGEGDDCSATIYKFEKNHYEQLSRSPRGASLGQIYASVTQYLGMKANEHEYKVMGLAPYAKDEDVERIYRRIRNIIYFDKNNPLILRSEFNTIDTGKYIDKYLKGVRFDVLAGAFQKLIEQKIIEWVNNAVSKTGITTLVLSGGVFMNVKANLKVMQLKRVKRLFVLPSCGDESTPLGACFYALLNKSDFESSKILPIKDIYWGPKFNNEYIEKVLKKRNIRKKYFVKQVADVEKLTAKLLSDRKIVARMKGRMEFGARALGNRSILANPQDTEIVRIINEQVKNRDFWMPFAPTIIKERSQDYLINHKKVNSPYMMIAFDSTPLAEKELKAAMHPYDFTIRPQILSQEYNPSYYHLISEFEKLTGIGAVLNTSFNLHGYPIVLGPDEALDAFENSKLEYLTLEDYIISKKTL